jgi:hypothetical protein
MASRSARCASRPTASRPLALESSVELPAWLAGASLAEATRLGIADGRVGRMVKTMLFKAFYQYCVAEDIDWMVIGARSPLDRMYAGLLFEDVFPGRGFIPLKHAGDLPHRILAFEIASAVGALARGAPSAARPVRPPAIPTSRSAARAGAALRPARRAHEAPAALAA